MSKPKILAIIGGGASGLSAAIESARILNDSGLDFDVIVFEKLPRVGKKILATGNGRCNLTNTNLNIENYHGDSDFAMTALEQFGYENTIDFFKSIGLLTAVEDEGRVYPLSASANSVLDCLRFEAERLGVEFKCDTPVSSIVTKNNRFIINNSFEADYVIVAAGGKSSPSQGSDGSGYDLLSKMGHKITNQFPALVQITTDTKFTRQLKGIKIKGKICLKSDYQIITEEKGEILFTDYGLSGIAVMQVSQYAGEYLQKSKVTPLIASLDLAESLTFEQVCDFIEYRIKANPELEAENLLIGLMPKRLGQVVFKYLDISPASIKISELSQKDIKAIAKAVKAFEIKVLGTKGFNFSQVTFGGADTNEFVPVNFESKKVKGLYACGEVLNVNGDCGGYNLQWAWASGYLAGKSCALQMSEEINNDKNK